MVELTETLLRDRYSVRHLCEKEIAAEFGTYQVKVGRLRRKWGIPTISMVQRVSGGLPELTSKQKELIVGSLLGDGRMRASSEHASVFSEGHSMSQSSYTDWKAAVLSPFTSSRHKGSKTDRKSGKTYYSWSLLTKTCTQLRPYYDLFYPAPLRVRVFPSNLYALMTPFTLAVWYMDDGNLTSRNEPCIAFGLCEVSLKRALRALRQLGLTPKVYGVGSDRVIHFPRQRVLFRQLVAEHIPACMGYKVPPESEGPAVHRKARILTPDEAAKMYLGGMSCTEIASLFDVGTSTVSRRLNTKGVLKRRPGPVTLGYSVEAADSALKDITGTPEHLESKAVEILSATPFPFLPELSPDEALADLRRVATAKMCIEDGSIMPLRRVGLRVCYPFFRSRYKAGYRGKMPAYVAWYDQKQLRRAVRWQVRTGDPVTPSRVLRAITANCRTPTVFRPTVAKALYERYAPNGGVTWDPCAGFGGRLVGALAAGLRYVATEVAPDVTAGNLKLARALGGEADVEIHLCPAEKFTPPPVDLVFTSPPYFHQECYSGGDQSWSCYPDFKSWVTGFLRPVIQLGAAALNSGGYWVLNIADVRDRCQPWPLVETSRKELRASGLLEVEQLKMPLASLNRVRPFEPVLVFRKP